MYYINLFLEYTCLLQKMWTSVYVRNNKNFNSSPKTEQIFMMLCGNYENTGTRVCKLFFTLIWDFIIIIIDCVLSYILLIILISFWKKIKWPLISYARAVSAGNRHRILQKFHTDGTFTSQYLKIFFCSGKGLSDIFLKSHFICLKSRQRRVMLCPISCTAR